VNADKLRLPQIAGYTTEAVLGVGGMATVYLAVQESLSRHVALKVMNQILMTDADFCRRFLNEGRLIAKLSHPNIVTVYDIGASEHFHYLSMTYLPGGTLREKIQRGLPLEYALYIAKCLADALGYAHRQGIVHRDIKPGNVLFTHSGSPVLTDFGIAKTMGNETKLTSAGMTVGSVGYMSPEQALGNEVDNRSDLYSLGVLLWQMLTGALPYSAQDPFALALKHANEPIPELPRPLDRFQPVIEGLMAKKPEDRLASAEELVRVIDGIRYEDIGSHSPSDSDETIILPRAAEPMPSHRTVVTEADVAPGPAPKRRRGLVAALIGIAGFAGVAAFIRYSGLLTPSPGAPATAPPAWPSPAHVAKTDTLPSASNKNSASPPAGLPAAQDGQSGDTAPAPDAKLPPAAPQGGGQRRIEALLRQAESQRKAGRLTEPPGDNAFESYTQVLDLDPEHPQAEQELVKIGRINAANKVFLSADALLRGGAIDDARRMIETGLRINPDDERLLGLQRALDYTQ
jgi:serine/threonine-protein kinase PpkA